MLFIGNYIKNLVFFHITKQRQYYMILGRPWVKKHKVLLDIVKYTILFSLRYYLHLSAFLVLESNILIAKTNLIYMAT